MGKLKGPRWDSDFDRWKKILLSWLRLQEKTTSNNEIIAAIILGLNESPKLKNGDSVVDVILELDEDELYPEDIPPLENKGAETSDTEVKQEEKPETAAKSLEKKFQLKDDSRPIPGLSKILETLKSKYSENEEVQLFHWYEKFECLVKNPNESMRDFIIKFEHLYKKLEKKDMKLPDVMLAYRLMKSANLGKDEMLAKVGVGNMSYERMKGTLLSMNDGIVQIGSNNKVTPKIRLVKDEPMEILFQDEEHSPSGSNERNEDFHEQYFDDQEPDSWEEDDSYNTFYQRRGNMQQQKLPKKTISRVCRII